MKRQLLTESGRAKTAQIETIQTQKVLAQTEASLKEKETLVEKVRHTILNMVLVF